jgi:hypothetical protein
VPGVQFPSSRRAAAIEWSVAAIVPSQYRKQKPRRNAELYGSLLDTMIVPEAQRTEIFALGIWHDAVWGIWRTLCFRAE